MKKFWTIILILVLVAGGLWFCSDWQLQSDSKAEAESLAAKLREAGAKGISTDIIK